MKLTRLLESIVKYHDSKDEVIQAAFEHWKLGLNYYSCWLSVEDADGDEVETRITFRFNKDHARNPMRNESDHNYSLVHGKGTDSYTETSRGINKQEFTITKDGNNVREYISNFMSDVLEFYKYN